MSNLTAKTGIARLFGSMGTPLLVLSTMFIVMFAGFDLLLPDPIPLIDEAILVMLMFGGVSELSRRRKLRAANKPLDPMAVRNTPADLKSLAARTQAVVEQASRLVGRGAAPQVGVRVRELAADVRAMVEELRRADAFLARKENDPWLVDRKLTKLGKQAVDLEVRGDDRKLEVARKALAVAQAHRDTVERRVGEREDVMVRMESISAQVDALGEDLGELLRKRHTGRFVTRKLGDLDPRVADVLTALEANAAAEAEVEEAVAANKRGRRRTPTGVAAL